jgi:N-acetylglucosamine-6-phosphate deacetylase
MAGILATVITDTLEAMAERLTKIVEMRELDPLVRDMVAGVHIEGPFINAERGYVGAHPAAAVRPAEVDAMRRLLDAAGGLTRIVTLAPENDPDFAVTKFLAKQASPFQQDIATPRSINCVAQSMPASRCIRTWATAAPCKFIATTISFSAC